ncbi:MAG TPA: DUF1972 domain-containing protein [Bacteroidia bacterium]|nr:DUF1972 domain-containing protein [Bacteroidia bacterium]
MKIALIGSRGIPARYGGFETFTEHLANDLVRHGHAVTVVVERNHPGAERVDPGIKRIESAYKKSVHPVWYYWDSLRLTIGKHDIVLVCGVGGALFYPMYRSTKTRLITNVDGLEHLRNKFSKVKKSYVRLAQRFTRQYSQHIIADGTGVCDFWKNALHVAQEKISIIEYGADEPETFSESALEKYGLKAGNYYLVIARLVPENHISEIVEGFMQTSTSRKLVIVGGKDNSGYVRQLDRLQSPTVLLIGGVYDKQVLDSLRIGAFAYLHGHSVGGTNPSLLEAMIAGAICVCHDNPFNREVTDNSQLYFSSGTDLTTLLESLEKFSEEMRKEYSRKSLARVRTYYTWERVCREYRNLFEQVHEGRKK